MNGQIIYKLSDPNKFSIVKEFNGKLIIHSVIDNETKKVVGKYSIGAKSVETSKQ